MKIMPYCVGMNDCWILGFSGSWSLGEIRIGICLVWIELGIEFRTPTIYD